MRSARRLSMGSSTVLRTSARGRTRASSEGINRCVLVVCMVILDLCATAIRRHPHPPPISRPFFRRHVPLRTPLRRARRPHARERVPQHRNLAPTDSRHHCRTRLPRARHHSPDTPHHRRAAGPGSLCRGEAGERVVADYDTRDCWVIVTACDLAFRGVVTAYLVDMGVFGAQRTDIAIWHVACGDKSSSMVATRLDEAGECYMFMGPFASAERVGRYH